MAQVLTTTASLAAIASQNGQGACIPVAKTAGCAGIEFRRELFREDPPVLTVLQEQIRSSGLLCVYSAPVELWLEDGALNVPMLDVIVPEALSLGALLVKTSLGHYRPDQSRLEQLREYWSNHVPEESALKLTVENDQTPHGGNVSRLQKFFEDCRTSGLPVGMTFDIGNWNWTGEDALQAAEALGSHVVYIHFKHVEKDNGKLVTLPLPEDADSLWRKVLARLPSGVLRTIEFPVEGEDVTEVLGKYRAMIADAKGGIFDESM